MITRWSLWLILGLFITGEASSAAPVRVAVAANFNPTLKVLLDQNRQQLGVPVSISTGSTGALYAQIRSGAPFDIFLAADSLRPQKLEDEGKTRLRTTYAFGRLVFWHKNSRNISEGSLLNYEGSLAMANPRHAPYGAAAAQLLAQLESGNRRLIQGSNVAQAFTFIDTGNVPAGLVALSQIIDRRINPDTYWLVPATRHAPIEQQLVILRNADERAESVVSFLQSAAVQQQIEAAGYDLPDLKGEAIGS